MSHQVTRDFEKAVEKYTGAPHCIAVSSCTDALELCLAWHRPEEVIIPTRTYASVPQVAIKQGSKIRWDPAPWKGVYRLHPLPVWDCAKRFTEGMYVSGQFQCLSFHVAKILGDTQGGAILTSNEKAAEWFRRARFDGRRAEIPLRDDTELFVGFHCVMSPDVASRLLLKMNSASFKSMNPDQGPDLEREYCDLSKVEAFRPHTRSFA